MTETQKLYVTGTETLYPGDTNYGSIVIRVYGRTKDNEPKRVTVRGFEPFFFARKEERDKVRPADHEDLIRYEEVDTAPLSERFDDDPTELVKVITKYPHSVSYLRKEFEKTWGADTIFTERFRIEKEVKTGVRIPKTDDRDVTVTLDEIEPVDFRDATPRVLTLDIETDDRDSGFPEPGDARILSIATHDSYSDEYVVFLDLDGESPGEFFDLSPVERAKLSGGDLSLSEMGITEPDRLVFKQSERDMLTAFGKFVRSSDPDVISGWNSGDESVDGFDIPHIIERMKAVGANANRLSREGEIEVQNRGDDFIPNISGRSLYDLMDGWEDTKFTNPRSKKLDDVAEKELDDAKIEHEEMGYFEMYSEDPAKFINYNVKDTRLTVGVNREANVLGFKRRLKDMVGVDWHRTHENNEFIEMSVRRKCHEHNISMITAYDNPKVIEAQKSSGVNFEGAYVFSAFSGVKRNVCGIDLASLYPMSQWMLNASPDTHLGDTVPDGIDEYVEAANGQKFRTDVDGIIRELVDEYHQVKAEFKAERNAATYGTEEWEDAAEAYNVTKTIYNSYWGYTGWDRSPLYDPRMGRAITSTGARVIKSTARFISEEAKDGVSVVYGDTDSVPAEEPVLVKDESGDIEYVEIQQLHGVEDQYQVWTEDGFTNIKKVWKKPNRKQNYTIRTKKGLVHTTEDHSLVRENGSMVKPGELTEGDHLLHRDVSDAIEGGSETMSTDRAWLYGFFAADGSAGIYDANTNGHEVKKHSFALNKNDTDLLERAQEVLRSEFGVNSNIHDYRESSGVRKLQLSDNGDIEWGGVNEVIDHFVDVSYTESREKHVPTTVLNGTDEIVEAFLDGYMGGDGYIGERYAKRFHEASTKDLHLASGLTMILQRLGYTFNIDYRRNHNSEYYRLRCQQYHRSNPEELRSVEEYGYDGEYVYDIETENHHFQAGAGNLIVHNSNYVEFPSEWSQEKTLEYASELCEELENTVYPELCDEFGIPREDNRWEIDVEMRAERFFQSGSKKRYAYLKMWDEGDDFDSKVNDGDGKFSVTGYECVKSNFSMMTKEVQEEVLEQIVRGADKGEVVETIHQAASSINADDPDWDSLGIPQGIGQKIDPDKAGQDDYYSWSTSGDHPRGEAPRAAWFSNHLLDVEFSKGDKPLRSKVKPSHTVNGESVDVIAYDSHRDLIGEGFRMDVSEMQRKCLENPMEDILDAFGVEVKAALRGSLESQSGLDAFM